MSIKNLWQGAFLALSALSLEIQADCRSHHKEVFDFVIVGAGNAGCVLANRLSENGKFSVCVLEAGRDDARLPDLLPQPSTANVPQPGDYQWGKYVRGNTNLFSGPLINRGFGSFHFYEKEDLTGPDPFRSTTYHRHAGWGGCTSHNFALTTRNPPENWNLWAEKGLNEWSFDNINKFYKLTENRSQVSFLGPYYSPAVPLGHLGSFDPLYYGFNGEIPLLYLKFLTIDGIPPNTFVKTIQNIVNTTLAPFGYPNFLVDADWPPGAALGGLTLNNFTMTDQFPTSTIVPPGESTAVNINNVYNPYHDGGFTYPPEWARLGLTGLTPFQRVSSANTYLYEAELRDNLEIKSNTLVTKVILSSKSKRAIGVEYLNGWNIYQTGRNPDAGQAGYGGSVGDAQFNGVAAKKEGTHKIYARKEVILCAGVFNTPQILLLSGIGDRDELKEVGIRAKVHLPGVGKHLIDNQELLPFWEAPPDSNPGFGIFPLLTAKSTLSQPFPNFQIAVGGITNAVLETTDIFVQQGWIGLKGLPAIFQSFGRNDFSNILLNPNPSIGSSNPVNGSPTFEPIIINFTHAVGMLVEQEENNRTEGYLQLVSKDPTVPPKIIFNYLQDPQDLQDWKDIMNNTVFPMMLALKNSTPSYFTNLLYPAPVDVLKPGIQTFTALDQIDQGRLENFLKKNVGGHHAGGTCKMGVATDPLAVVDQKGLVYGVKGLRVCDNSILPLSIYWPNGTLYVVGEKISADILAKYAGRD